MLKVEDLRTEFARHLAADPCRAGGLDSALRHVIQLAYQRGLDDGIAERRYEREARRDDKYAAAMEAGENPFCP